MAQTLPVVVGLPEDNAPRELRHSRTLAPHKEEYVVSSPCIHARVIVTSDDDLGKKAKKTKVGKVKKKHQPGPERYERNPHEPIKC